ncbi:MAG: SH3 domain-containing protein [Spirochaetales bacterium]|nr:SH3 domain-containing protein [Spirochaetales bacterium]
MKKIIYILIVLSLMACEKKAEQEDYPVAGIQEAETIIPEAIVITGTSTTDHLRIRELPYLDAGKVGSLMDGEEVTILSQSAWTESIDSFNQPWYEIDYKGKSYWVYGGYIETTADEIPLNDTVEQRVFTSFPDSHGEIGTDGFSDFRIPHISIYPEFDDSDPDNQSILINEDYLYLLNSPDPQYEVKVTLRSEGGDVFQKKYISQEIDPLLINPYAEYGNLPNLALFIPFNRNATLNKGIWEASIEIDYNYSVSKTFPMVMKKMTTSLSEEIDVFSKLENVSAGYKDKVYIYLNDLKPNEDYYIALYSKSGEEVGESIYSAVYAAEFSSDSKGKISTSLLIGYDLKPETYKLTYGSSKEDMNYFLFENEITVK